MKQKVNENYKYQQELANITMLSKNEILGNRANGSVGNNLHHGQSFMSTNGRGDNSLNASLSSRDRAFVQRSLVIDPKAPPAVIMDRRAKMNERNYMRLSTKMS